MKSSIPQPTLTPFLLILMAVAAGVSVASNYYAQPLLHTLSEQFSVSKTVAGTIITIAQLCYAFGLILFVPLGDILERRRLIVVMMLLTIIGLVVSATSNNFIQLLIGTALTGFFVVVVQVLVPFAATLSAPAYRGRAVGVVMSGLLLGILLARTFSGIVSYYGGWRSVYWVAAALMLLITIALAIKLPKYPATVKVPYPRLVQSIYILFKESSDLRERCLLGGLDFAVFSILWTPLAFFLAEQYHYSDMTIGLFGLFGAAGALVAPYAGKFADQGKAALFSSIGFLILALSWIPIYFASSSVIALIIGILFLDMAVQLVHILNMNEVIKIKPEARNRLNASYMFAYFVGGTLGSLSSAYAYEHYQWAGVVCLGLAVSVAAIIAWEIYKRKITQCI